jgi:drug/metabolite transporter (DMT)-like permease
MLGVIQMEKQNKQPLISPLPSIFAGVVIMSTSSIIIRYAQAEVNSLVIATYRLVLAVLVLSPYVIWHNRAEIKNLSRTQIHFLLLSGLFLAVHFASWITSLAYTSVASSIVLVSTVPIWVALLSPVLIKEPVHRWAIIGMAIATLGTVLIGIDDACVFSGTLNCPPISEFVQGKAFWGDMLALVGALTGAGYVLIGRQVRAKISNISYIFVVYGFAALFMTLLTVGTEQPLSGYSPMIYLWLFLLAIGPQLIGHSTVNWALGFLPAAFVAITMLGEPIGSIVLAYFLLNEIPGPIKLVGAIMILSGIILASRQNLSNKPVKS